MSLTRFQEEEIATIKGMAKFDMERALYTACAHLREGIGHDSRKIPGRYARNLVVNLFNQCKLSKDEQERALAPIGWEALNEFDKKKSELSLQQEFPDITKFLKRQFTA